MFHSGWGGSEHDMWYKENNVLDSSPCHEYTVCFIETRPERTLCFHFLMEVIYFASAQLVIHYLKIGLEQLSNEHFISLLQELVTREPYNLYTVLCSH